MGSLPRSVYQDLVAKRVIEPAEEVPPPTVPMDYSWARVSAQLYLPFASLETSKMFALMLGFMRLCLAPRSVTCELTGCPGSGLWKSEAQGRLTALPPLPLAKVEC